MRPQNRFESSNSPQAEVTVGRRGTVPNPSSRHDRIRGAAFQAAALAVLVFSAAASSAEDLEKVDAYLKGHKPAFVSQLCDLVSIPSVSAQPAHDADSRRAAVFLRDDLRAMGFLAELIEPKAKGHPVVYAEWTKAAGRPTLLIYGHYDVQPADGPKDGWTSDPFVPTIRGDIIHGRGVTDDKGQLLTHLKAAEAWLRAVGTLPVNVNFLLEGDEESGGGELEEIVSANRDRFKCDVAVISDTSMFGPGVPAITYGLRGIAYFEVKVQGASEDLHSGSYGGVVANPLNALAHILDATLQGPDGRVQLPGFYDGVIPLANWERESFSRLLFDEGAPRLKLGVPTLAGEPGYSALERKWARPTGDLHGIFGGYSGPGAKTVLPRTAGAKFSFRLVPGQDPDKIRDELARHLRRVCPKGVSCEIVDYFGTPAVLVPVDSPAVRAAARAIEVGFGNKPVFTREGGTIPVVSLFKTRLGADTLLLGWGQPDDAAHGPNEKMSLLDFHRGIKTSTHLMAEMAGIAPGH